MNSTVMPRIFCSGEQVGPGTYRDLETGALIHVFDEDELPDNTQVIRTVRLFVLMDQEPEEEGELS